MLYAREIELTLERVLRLLEQREQKGQPLSRADVAKAIGMSAATVSNFLNRKEGGDAEKVAALLRAYVEREEAKDAGGVLTIPFVETRPAKKMLDLVQLCLRHSQIGAGIASSGIGKTTTIAEAQRRDPGLIVVDCWGALGQSGMLQELCDALRLSDKGLQRAMMKRLKHKLTDSGRCLILDNAHRLSFRALDVVVHLHDQTGIGVVLLGIGTLKRHLIGVTDELEQLASRAAGRVWDIPELNEQDARLLLGAVLSEREVDVAMGLVAQDPQLLASGRRLANLIQIAALLAKRRKEPLGLDHIRHALKAA